uniref:Uncharacterized protein n=1 Tax=Anopheles atroparvus TaxID=41427 RepID=A0A182IUH9_ANOAO
MKQCDGSVEGVTEMGNDINPVGFGAGSPRSDGRESPVMGVTEGKMRIRTLPKSKLELLINIHRKSTLREAKGSVTYGKLGKQKGEAPIEHFEPNRGQRDESSFGGVPFSRPFPFATVTEVKKRVTQVMARFIIIISINGGGAALPAYGRIIYAASMMDGTRSAITELARRHSLH